MDVNLSDVNLEVVRMYFPAATCNALSTDYGQLWVACILELSGVNIEFG